MGATLSKDEEQELASHLLGIEPASLAAVIWDTMNNVGVDDENDKFGINFEAEGETSQVMFWDNGEAIEMPHRVFLEILDMMSGRIITTYETDYDLDKSPELKFGVDKLVLARQHLQKDIGSMHGQECAKHYRSRLDSILSVEDEGIAEEMVQEVRQRRGSMMWSNGQSSVDSRRRMSSRGLEAVVDRLPELRKRYEAGTKRQGMKKVRNKIIALRFFGSKIQPSSSFKEEDEEELEEHAQIDTHKRRQNQLMRSHKSGSMKSQHSVTQPDQPVSPSSHPVPGTSGPVAQNGSSRLFLSQSDTGSGKSSLSQSDTPISSEAQNGSGKSSLSQPDTPISPEAQNGSVKSCLSQSDTPISSEAQNGSRKSSLSRSDTPISPEAQNGSRKSSLSRSDTPINPEAQNGSRKSSLLQSDTPIRSSTSKTRLLPIRVKLTEAPPPVPSKHPLSEAEVDLP